MTPREEGFSLIEVLVAMLVLAIGILALAATLDGSRKVSNTSERLTAASAVAQRQLEDVTGRTYKTYANIGQQAPLSPDLNDEALQFVCGPNSGGSVNTFRWDLTTCGTTAVSDEQYIAPTGGILQQKGWFDARTNARGQVYTLVTWVDEDCASIIRTTTCAQQDYKRVTVAVTTTNGPPDRPVVVSTFIPNPNEDLPANCEPIIGCTNPYITPGLQY